jgi:hypothetical protein
MDKDADERPTGRFMKSLFMNVIGLVVVASASMTAFAQNFLPLPEQIELSNPPAHFAIPNQEYRNALWAYSRMPEGPYKGEFLDLSERRPPIVLHGKLWTAEGEKTFTSNIGTEIPIATGDKMVLHIEHLGKQYLALVDTDDAEMTSASFSQFQFAAEHFFTMTTFSRPDAVRLIAEVIHAPNGILARPQIKMLTEPIKMRHLIVASIEGTNAQGRGGYSLVEKGLFNKMAQTYKITTVPSRLLEWIVDDHPQMIVDTNANKLESIHVLENNLFEADRAGNTFMYNTWFDNCTNRGLAGLERGMGKRTGRTLLQQLGSALGQSVLHATSLSQNIPVFTRVYGLFLRGYQDLSKKPYGLHEIPEFRPWIDQILKDHPDSKAVKVMEDLDAKRDYKCNASLRGNPFMMDWYN